jgi:hypothetical protein
MSRFKKYMSESVGGKLPDGWTQDSVVKLGQSMGISPGEHGFFDACVAKFDGKMPNAKGFCANVKDVFYGSTYWRGKGKEKSDVEKQTKSHQNVK